MSAQVCLEYMSIAEIVAARARAPVAFVPISPLEWHSYHLPFGPDGLHAHHIAQRTAQQTGGVVLPTLFVGTDSLRPTGAGAQGVGLFGIDHDERVVGMDLPDFPVRSLYYHETVLGLLVRETVALLARDQWRIIVLVGGHGAPNHPRMLQRVAHEQTQLPELEVRYETAWAPGPEDGPGGGHADRYETSVMLALESGSVHLDQLPGEGPLAYRQFGIVDGPAFDGKPTEDFSVRTEADPRGSSREEGEQIVDYEVRHMVEVINGRLAALTSPR